MQKVARLVGRGQQGEQWTHQLKDDRKTQSGERISVSRFSSDAKKQLMTHRVRVHTSRWQKRSGQCSDKGSRDGGPVQKCPNFRICFLRLKKTLLFKDLHLEWQCDCEGRHDDTHQQIAATHQLLSASVIYQKRLRCSRKGIQSSSSNSSELFIR